MRSTVTKALHLARRFIGSLSRKRPGPADQEWIRSILSEGEMALWGQMSAPDQRHAVEVSRQVSSVLGVESSPPGALAAAALHDVGKVDSGLGTFQRVGATIFWLVLPSHLAITWSQRGGVVGRLARYHLHPDLGAELLRQAGSAPLTVAWAAEHHRAESAWTVDAAVGAVLRDCDND